MSPKEVVGVDGGKTVVWFKGKETVPEVTVRCSF